jgi:hypothetical protein
MTIKYTKMTIKYTKIFRSKAFKVYQNWNFWCKNIPSGNPAQQRFLRLNFDDCNNKTNKTKYCTTIFFNSKMSNDKMQLSLTFYVLIIKHCGAPHGGNEARSFGFHLLYHLLHPNN